MNKNDLHQKILEKMSSQGIDISNIDQEKCGVIKNHYHVLNKRGDLLLRFNINKLNKTKAKLNPKTKSNFLLGCGIVLAIPGMLFLFTILIPILIPTISSFNSVNEKAKVSAVKNGLVNGIKECLVRAAENKTTRFGDVTSFLDKYAKFKLESLDPNSCYKAKAVPTNDQNTWFEIDYDQETGKVSRICGDSSKSGCEKDNTW